MSMASEFKEFALKGNVMDLAVGVIIGGAFGKIVDSLIGDIVMPVVGKIFGGLDFANSFIALNFIILAFIIFMMVKTMNRMKREAPAAPPAPPAPPAEDVVLLREIRDALKR